jgi:hypothetical protein
MVSSRITTSLSAEALPVEARHDAVEVGNAGRLDEAQAGNPDRLIEAGFRPCRGCEACAVIGEPLGAVVRRIR